MAARSVRLLGNVAHVLLICSMQHPCLPACLPMAPLLGAPLCFQSPGPVLMHAHAWMGSCQTFTSVHSQSEPCMFYCIFGYFYVYCTYYTQYPRQSRPFAQIERLVLRWPNTGPPVTLLRSVVLVASRAVFAPVVPSSVLSLGGGRGD